MLGSGVRAGWGGRVLNIDDFEHAIICIDCEVLVLYTMVDWEKDVCAHFLVMYRVLNKGPQAVYAAFTRAIIVEGLEFRKVS